MPTASVAGILLGPWLFSFQRYVCPVDMRVSYVPSSLGALPVGDGDSAYLLPVANDEAFWIGVEAQSSLNIRQIEVEILRVDDTRELLPLIVGGALVVAVGTRQDDGFFEPLCRRTTRELYLRVGNGCVSVKLADPSMYSKRTGLSQVQSIDPAAGYGGWKLP